MLFQGPNSAGSKRQAQPAPRYPEHGFDKPPGCRLLTNVKPLLSRKDLINPSPLIVTETRRRHENLTISMLDSALFQFIYVKCQHNLVVSPRQKIPSLVGRIALHSADFQALSGNSWGIKCIEHITSHGKIALSRILFSKHAMHEVNRTGFAGGCLV